MRSCWAIARIRMFWQLRMNIVLWHGPMNANPFEQVSI